MAGACTHPPTHTHLQVSVQPCVPSPGWACGTLVRTVPSHYGHAQRQGCDSVPRLHPLTTLCSSGARRHGYALNADGRAQLPGCRCHAR